MILVTSSTPGEGKTTISINLSASLAQQKKRVLLIEGDLRRPTVLAKLKMQPTGAGLSELLSRGGEPEPIAVEAQPGLFVLFAGPVPPLPAELVGSEIMENLIQRMRGEFDFIVIDSPPILPVADARVMAHLADATVMVTRVDLTARTVLARALTILRASVSEGSRTFVGGILNGLAPGSPAYYGYYGKRYAEYYVEGGK